MNRGRLALLLALVAWAAGASCRSGGPVTAERGPTTEVTNGCAALAPEACAARSDCTVVQAQQADTGGRCLRPALPVGCRPAAQGCDDAHSFAQAPDGRCFRLPDTCLPAGFVSPPPDSACAQASFSEDRPCP
jgi:hypothetical protein